MQGSAILVIPEQSFVREVDYIGLCYQMITMHVVILSLQICDFFVQARYKMPIFELFLRMG